METFLTLLKAENPEAYKKLAEKGIMVAHPVTINGQSHRPDNQIHYHSTIKFFNPEKDSPAAIHDVAKGLKFTTPDPHKTRIEPGMFKDRMGNDVYVIKLHGEHADEIKGHNKKFSHMGYPSTFEYTPHVSVDKKTWDRIKESKAQTAAEAGISFGAAELRQGHNVLATYHHSGTKEDLPEVPKQAPEKTKKLAASEVMVGEPLEKGALNKLAAITGMAAGLAGATPTQEASSGYHQHQQQNQYSSQKMLNAISSVESSGGKFVNHRVLNGIHGGEKAYGKYGLTPVVIRETVNMHKDLKQKHGKIVGLQGADLHHYMQDNPGLEEEIAQRHLNRLEHHFGQDPAHIGYAWLEGITGTYRAKREKENVHDHWHVKKIKTAYGG